MTAKVIHLRDIRKGCAVCGRPQCEGDCPISEHDTFILACDICNDRTAVLCSDPYAPDYLSDWKREHKVHHVYLNPAGKSLLGAQVIDSMCGVVTPCDESEPAS